MKKLLIILLCVLSFARAHSQATYMTEHLIPGSENEGYRLPGLAGQAIPFLMFNPPDATNTLNGVYDGVNSYQGRKYPAIFFGHGQGEVDQGVTNPANRTTAQLYRLYTTTPASLLRYTTSELSNKRYAAPGKTDSTQFYWFFPQVWGPSPSVVTNGVRYGSDYFWLFYAWELRQWIVKYMSHIIDTNRIYIAGLSFGAGWVWTVAQDSVLNGYFAAGKPDCPGFNTYADFKPSGVPVAGQTHNWKFLAKSGFPIDAAHAINDPTTVQCNGVGSCITDRCIDSLLKYSPLVSPRYRKYTDGGHSIWNRTWSPSQSATNFSLTNGNTTNYLISIQSWFLQFSTDGRRRPTGY